MSVALRMHVHTCVCMMCMNACMYVCMCVRMYVNICMHIICMCIRMYVNKGTVSGLISYNVM